MALLARRGMTTVPALANVPVIVAPLALNPLGGTGKENVGAGMPVPVIVKLNTTPVCVEIVAALLIVGTVPAVTVNVLVSVPMEFVALKPIVVLPGWLKVPVIVEPLT